MDHVAYTELDLKKSDDQCAKSAQAYADAIANKKVVDGLLKNYLAALKLEIHKEGMSQSECEMRARGSKEWSGFYEAQAKKILDCEKAKIRYDNDLRRWSTIRSALSLKKAEISRGM